MHQNFLFLCLTVKIKLKKRFDSAIFIFFYTGKQKTLIRIWQVALNGILQFYQTAQLLSEHW